MKVSSREDKGGTLVRPRIPGQIAPDLGGIASLLVSFLKVENEIGNSLGVNSRGYYIKLGRRWRDLFWVTLGTVKT
jgi:hypothetical protein